MVYTGQNDLPVMQFLRSFGIESEVDDNDAILIRQDGEELSLTKGKAVYLDTSGGKAKVRVGDAPEEFPAPRRDNA